MKASKLIIIFIALFAAAFAANLATNVFQFLATYFAGAVSIIAIELFFED